MIDSSAAGAASGARVCYRPLDGLLLLVAIAFLAFVPFGSAPFVWPGPSIDNLVGVVLALLVAAEIARRRRVPVIDGPLVLAVALFLLIALASVAASPDPLYSLGRYLVIFGYAFVAVMLPPLVVGREMALLRGLAMAGFAAAAVIVLSYLVLGMPSWGRMTIPTWYVPAGQLTYFPEGWGSSPDPNMLGIGLVYAGLAWLAAGRPRVGRLLGFAFILAAVLSTGSRTALLGLVAGGVAAAALTLLKTHAGRIRVRVSGGSLIAAVIAAPVAIGAALAVIWVTIGGALRELWLARIAKGAEERVEMVGALFATWEGSAKSVWLGEGFHLARTIEEPHNIYLSTFYDVGLPGLVLFLAILVAALALAWRIEAPRWRLLALWIWGALAVSGLTYWHTKTWWVPLLLIALLHGLDRGRAAPTQQRDAAARGRAPR